MSAEQGRHLHQHWPAVGARVVPVFGGGVGTNAFSKGFGVGGVGGGVGGVGGVGLGDSDGAPAVRAQGGESAQVQCVLSFQWVGAGSQADERPGEWE